MQYEVDIKTPPNTSKICRACLNTPPDTESMVPLFKNQMNDMFQYSTGIELSRTDKLPQHVCRECSCFIKNMYKFKKQCITSDENLKKNILLSVEVQQKPSCSKSLLKEEILENDNFKIEYDTEKGTFICRKIYSTIKEDTKPVFNPDDSDDDDFSNLKPLKKEPSVNEDNVGESSRPASATKPRRRIKLHYQNQENPSLVKNIENINLTKTEFSNCDVLSKKLSLACGLCQHVSECFEDLCLHIESHKSNDSCQYNNCSYVHIDWSNFVCHRFTHLESVKSHPYFPCHLCDLIMNSQKGLEKHMRFAHFDNELNCKFCNKTYKNITYLKIHVNNIHIAFEQCLQTADSNNTFNNKDVSWKKLKQNLEVKCDLCSYITYSKRRLIHHLETDHAFKKQAVPCDLCNKEFLNEACLRNHKKFYHFTPKHICPVCGKPVIVPAFEKHLEAHKRQKYVCKVCQKVMTTQGGYQLHIRRHINGSMYKCHKCPAAYTKPDSLNRHLWSHYDPSVKKPHVCHICNKGFILSTKLKLHMQVHGIFLCKNSKKQHKGTKYA